MTDNRDSRLEKKSDLNQEVNEFIALRVIGPAPWEIKEQALRIFTDWNDETERNSYLCEFLLPNTLFGKLFAPAKEDEFTVEDEFIKKILTLLNDTVIKTGSLKLSCYTKLLLSQKNSYREKEKDFRLANLSKLYPQFFAELKRQWVFFQSLKSQLESRKLCVEANKCQLQAPFIKTETLLLQAQQLDATYANHYLLEFFIATNQWEKCLELLSGLQLDTEQNIGYLGLRGKIYLLQKNFALAEKDFLAMTNVYLHMPELIACYLGQGKNAEALKLYKAQVKGLSADRQLQSYLYLKAKNVIQEQELDWEARGTASYLKQKKESCGIGTEEAVLVALVTQYQEDLFSALDQLSRYVHHFNLTMFNFNEFLISSNTWALSDNIESFKFRDLKKSKVQLLNGFIYERDVKVRQIALLQALMPHTLLGAFFSLGHVQGVRPSAKVLAALENELSNHPLDRTARDFLQSQKQTLQAYPLFLNAITKVIEKQRKYHLMNGGAVVDKPIQIAVAVKGKEQEAKHVYASEGVGLVAKENRKVASFGTLTFFEIEDPIATKEGQKAKPSAKPYRRK